ncbi:S8 family serine peptidase [Streptomyces sp. TRM 70351]|uniref:S8 family peptidase n=1 Tax=Streptomyces sp. TRM 70351 TaxID=3116552 RepID=UPI002E7C20C7|nr:S8 family serine peptidase [Streptomyces sp. TRM 70351]MEE1926737.1 S8 family serine peptidase [Streptomyces sp. TRM 70351]
MSGRHRARAAAVAAAAALAAPLPPAQPAHAAPDRVDTACSRPPQEGAPLPDVLPGRPLADRLGLVQAWDLADGTGVTVGIVDSGVDGRHPELSGAVEPGTELATVRTAEEFRQQRPRAPHLDCAGHGTAVAGLLAARRGGERRVTGVAPGARIHPVRVVDGVDRATGRTLAAGIDAAVDAGARVLNLSFALPVDREPVRRAVARAVARDVVVVAAAGNEGTRGTPVYPAAYPGVLAVGAVDADGQPLDASNQGDWVDLAAYGDAEIAPASGGSGYQQVTGTSFAAPQVSGAAALIRSRFPGLGAPEVARRLVESAAPVGGGPNPRTGAGLVDPFAALTHLGDAGAGAGGGTGAADDAGRPGAVPVQAVPREEPLLTPAAATALAWSGGLLLAVALTLLGAPAVRRAAARGWRPGPPGGAPAAPRARREHRPEPAALERIGPAPGPRPGSARPGPARTAPGAARGR